MIEKEILYWMLALNMVLAIWLLVLNYKLSLARLLRQDAEKLLKHYRALYELKATRQEARLNDD